MSPVTPVSDLIALRSRVSTAMRQEMMANGNSAAYGRLTRLRGAIQDNLGSSISDAVQSDQAKVAQGTLAPGDAIDQRIQSLKEQWGLAPARAGIGGAQGATGYAGGGTTPVPGIPGAGSAQVGGSGIASGRQGLPPIPQLGGNGPTFDADAAQRLAAATAATKARAGTFGAQPLSNVTATNGTAGSFRLPDGSVPSKFFHSGTRAFTDTQTLLQATPEAAGTLADYAAQTLRREATNGDGVVDPAKFTRWQAKYGDALRALPPVVQARFADAGSAGAEVADAAQAQAEAARQAKLGAVGRVMQLSEPQDVIRTVGNILSSRTSTADMTTLANQARADPNAFQGLRQAVADHIAQRFVGNPDASGVGALNGDSFQTFVGKNRGALSQVFTSQEMANLDAIGADIQRSRSAASLKAGSNQIAQGVGHVAAHTAFDMVAAMMGHHFGGEMGSGLAVGASEALQAIRSAGVARIDQVVSQALLNPEVARRLLTKVPNDPHGQMRVLSGVAGALSAANGLYANAQRSAPSQAGKQLPQVSQ